jgi:hypothetical protein
MINDFIAWDKVNKRFMPRFTIQDCVDSIDTPFTGKDVIAGLHKDVYDVLQSTGVKDKNGNTIYEKFYVKHWIGGKEVVSLVEWNEDYLTYLPLGGINGCCGNCIIIGNKYETPDLLTKK